MVRLAAEQNWAILPRGGGTQMELGGIPRRADVALCTTDMNSIVEYEPADLVCTVQAGLRLADLQRALSEHGQQLPLDPPLPDRATIGGIIAANSSGPLRLRYGTCRDLLIGVKVVNPDGQITKVGGKVVKNVTGYDMCKLYTGSLGTLGVVVQASFKLAPLPRARSTLLAGYRDVGQAYAAARAIHGRALPILACELLSPVAAQRILASAIDSRAFSSVATQQPGAVLAVWIAGGPAAVERQKRDVKELCGPAQTVVFLEGAAHADWWRAVEDAGRDASTRIVAKISVIPARTGDLLAALPADLAFVSHALSGVSYIFDVDPRALQTIVQALGGYLVVERCPLEMKGQIDVWGPTGEDFDLMRRIKEQFDPRGLLNPGRYVGGL